MLSNTMGNVIKPFLEISESLRSCSQFQDQMQKSRRKNGTHMVYGRHPKSCLLSGIWGLGEWERKLERMDWKLRNSNNLRQSRLYKIKQVSYSKTFQHL